MPRNRRPLRSRHARLALQSLEAREVPAGTILASFSNGVLTLTGDDASNAVTILTGAGVGAGPHVKIIPDVDTQINDLGPGVEFQQDGVTSIRASFAGGNDEITLSSTLDLTGSGDPDFDLSGVATFDLGDGDNTLNASPTGKVVVQDLSIAGGDGFDHVVVSPRDAGSGIATGKRQHKPVTFNMGDGGYDVTFSNFAVPGRAGVRFSSGHAGGGAGGSFAAENLNIEGPFIANTNEGLNSFSFGATNMGSVSISAGGGGAGKLAVALSDVQGTPDSGSHVSGDVRVTGYGDLSLTVSNSAVDKSARVQKKWLPSNFRTTAVANFDGSDVGGGVDVSAMGSSHQSSLFIAKTTVGGPVNLRSTGPNGMSVLFLTDADIDGALNVMTTGRGAGNSLNNFTGKNSSGPVSIRSSFQAMATVNGNLTVTGPNGVPGDYRMTAGQTANLHVANGALAARNLDVSGSAAAMLALSLNGMVDLDGKLSLSSQGLASLGDVDGDGQLDVVGAVSVSGGDQATVNFGPNGPPASGFWKSGATSVSSPMGAAHVRFDPLVLDLKGDLTVQGGFLTNVSVSPDPATPDTLAGNIRVRGGSGDDTVLIQDVDGIKDMQLDLGSGENSATLRKTISFPHALEVNGRLSISGGNGADAIRLQDVLVSSLTSIKTGGGADALVIFGESTFADTSRVDLGAGDDLIEIGLLVGSTGPVTFQKALALNAGAGNDRLDLGLAENIGDVNTRVVFATDGNVIDGGTGLNFFDDEAGQFSFRPGTDLQKVFLNWVDPVA